MPGYVPVLDLDLDPMTFIYKPDLYPADQRWTFDVKNFESYRITDIQTDATENIIIADGQNK